MPLVFIYTPLQFILCIAFLYKILSWSSLIGMFTMFITMPLPGLFTKLNAKYQQERMKAVSRGCLWCDHLLSVRPMLVWTRSLKVCMFFINCDSC